MSDALSSAAPASAGAAVASVQAAPAIPFKRDAAGAAGALGGGALGVLILSLVAIVVVLVVRKRLRLGGPVDAGAGLLRVLETRRLGPRALLSVVEFDGARYLIAQSEQGVQCLAQHATKEAP